MSNFHDIASGPKDTFAELTARQRDQLRQHRIQESTDALALIVRVAKHEEWPEEELQDVLGMLGISGEPGTDRDSYAALALPRSEPGRPPRKPRAG